MARRPVIIVVVLAFLAGAFVLESGSDDAPVLEPPALGELAPTVADASAPTSTWYCAAGTALGTQDGAAEQTVVLSNAADEDRQATLTAFTGEAEQASTVVTLGAGTRTDVAVSDLVNAGWAAVLVEVDGGGVAVEHVLRGPTGTSAGPCSSTVSPSWYLPAGTTVLGVGHWLAVFNPFPDEAVVDLTFETETDTRTPPELQGLVVPGRSVRVVDVAEVVTVREQLATTVVARSGLVVVEQVEAVTEEAELPTALSVTLAAPVPTTTWELAEGRPLAPDVDVQVVVMNPGEVPAEVDVQLLVDDPATNGFVEPYQLSIRPGQYAVVDLRQDGRLPEGLGWWAWAESRNGTPIVAGLVVRAGGDAVPRGQVIALGSPLVGPRWSVPLGGVAGGPATNLSVANPASTESVTVSVRSVVGGSVSDVAGLTDIEVAPGGRVVLELAEAIDPATASLLVEASGPVVVARTTVFPETGGSSTAPAIVWLDGAALPQPSVGDAATSPTVVLDGIDPESTAEVPGTGAPGTATDGSTTTEVPSSSSSTSSPSSSTSSSSSSSSSSTSSSSSSTSTTAPG